LRCEASYKLVAGSGKGEPVSFEFLFGPVEHLDAWITGLFAGAPLLAALGLAFVLGLRHASDPDHLVAVTSLMAADDGDSRGAVRLGAWWGLGHALVLLGVGLPLIAFKSDLPPWLGAGAEKAVGAVIVVLAARVTWKWVRGEYRAGFHRHHDADGAGPGSAHRHLRRGRSPDHHFNVRTSRQAFAIGLLHGLAGTGAVVVLLIAALPTQLEAAAALAVFAPMTLISMAALTGAFAWLLTRRVIEPVYRAVLIPALGLFGLMFGLWYAGLT
jgi:ABC-type nickel/cobalt efflux system permease component RcnA